MGEAGKLRHDGGQPVGNTDRARRRLDAHGLYGEAGGAGKRMGGALRRVVVAAGLVAARRVHGMQAGRLRAMQRRRGHRHPAGERGAQNGEDEEDLPHAPTDRRPACKRKGPVGNVRPFRVHLLGRRATAIAPGSGRRLSLAGRADDSWRSGRWRCRRVSSSACAAAASMACAVVVHGWAMLSPRPGCRGASALAAARPIR